MKPAVLGTDPSCTLDFEPWWGLNGCKGLSHGNRPESHAVLAIPLRIEVGSYRHACQGFVENACCFASICIPAQRLC